ncbi:4-demethylwyosine synthase TYW1 [Candidatus Woesearchaeota archaeon]|nr:4-demethylwyosine synthase TYW1 [Candidatus Woesearchaeota archaeon]
MDAQYKKLLQKQHYEFIGDHSAVKVCEWTKKSLRAGGHCYKQKFYGIRSHQCVQMTVAVNFCDMDCVYCWRERNNSPFTTIDDPKALIDNAIRAQRKQLSGFGGNKDANGTRKLEESRFPMHFAISLNGENLYYPRLSELIAEIRRRGGSSFLVTNGQLPDVLAKLEMPTQLYISIDAPNSKLQKEITRALHPDSWERLLRSLDIVRELKGKTRTVVRITCIKGMNMIDPAGYARLIERAKPDFVEVKGYMFIGASRERLAIKNMPLHSEVVQFSQDISKECGYKLIDEQPASRVTLLMKEDAPWRKMDFSGAALSEAPAIVHASQKPNRTRPVRTDVREHTENGCCASDSRCVTHDAQISEMIAMIRVPKR